MQHDAQKDGIDIAIASSFRSFEQQLAIWNAKFSGAKPVFNEKDEKVDITQLPDIERIQAIMLYSALPGASRHHWGTDIDLYSPSLLPSNQALQLAPWEYEQDGYFYPLTQWLTNNASKYGYYWPYDKYRGGVAAEPWHLSFGALSKPFLSQLTLDVLAQCIAASNIMGKQALLDSLPALYDQYVVNVG